MTTLDYFVPRDTALHQDMIDLERDEYAAVLGHKVLGGIKNDDVKNAMTTQFGAHNDGFRLLRSIMRNHVVLLRRPHTPAAYVAQTHRPTYVKTTTIYNYEVQLQLYYHSESAYGRVHQEVEKTNTFLAGISSDSRCTGAIKEACLHCPESANVNGDVPFKYCLGSLADTIANYTLDDPAIGFDVYQADTPQVNNVEASDDKEDTAFIGRTDGKPYSRNDGKPFQKRDYKHGSECRNQCPPSPKVQCNVCMQFGHTGNCDFMAKLFWTLEYMKENEPAAKISF